MGEKVLRFIKIFQSDYNEYLFTNCACYWMSLILSERFNGIIMYNPYEVHFATMISDSLYDITGKIEDTGYVLWDTYDGSDKDDIRRECVNIT